jgi:hypothetical protein
MMVEQRLRDIRVNNGISRRQARQVNGKIEPVQQGSEDEKQEESRIFPQQVAHRVDNKSTLSLVSGEYPRLGQLTHSFHALSI